MSLKDPSQFLASIPPSLLTPTAEKDFDLILETIMKKDGKKIRKRPVIGGKWLSLFYLFLQVEIRGGFSHVYTHKRFKEVGEAMGIDSSSVTSVGYILRTKYEKYIDPYVSELRSEIWPDSPAISIFQTSDESSETDGIHISESFRNHTHPGSSCPKAKMSISHPCPTNSSSKSSKSSFLPMPLYEQQHLTPLERTPESLVSSSSSQTSEEALNPINRTVQHKKLDSDVDKLFQFLIHQVIDLQSKVAQNPPPTYFGKRRTSSCCSPGISSLPHGTSTFGHSVDGCGREKRKNTPMSSLNQSYHPSSSPSTSSSTFSVDSPLRSIPFSFLKTIPAHILPSFMKNYPCAQLSIPFSFFFQISQCHSQAYCSPPFPHSASASAFSSSIPVPFVPLVFPRTLTHLHLLADNNEKEGKGKGKDIKKDLQFQLIVPMVMFKCDLSLFPGLTHLSLEVPSNCNISDIARLVSYRLGNIQELTVNKISNLFDGAAERKSDENPSYISVCFPSNLRKLVCNECLPPPCLFHGDVIFPPSVEDVTLNFVADDHQFLSTEEWLKANVTAIQRLWPDILAPKISIHSRGEGDGSICVSFDASHVDVDGSDTSLFHSRSFPRFSQVKRLSLVNAPFVELGMLAVFFPNLESLSLSNTTFLRNEGKSFHKYPLEIASIYPNLKVVSFENIHGEISHGEFTKVPLSFRCSDLSQVSPIIPSMK
ncbi:hypothetical protein ADUPG1_013295 [Aduncisulcus paluster]|uniref:ARID domain-containing protein n=1 Tax=Aduncisulcus paluster TaxID=2918883 RepID=A0ABQ5K2F6_9EUKA|nr:hypothetical protein ADUPG1_013295 [Aduncisulcus paluster]